MGAVVRSLLQDGEAVIGVMTDEGGLDGDVVVLAAGPWTPPLLRTVGVNVPISGARGWLVHLGPERPPLSRVVGRAGWHIPPKTEPTPLTTASQVVDGPPKANTGSILQPNADGTLLVGGSRQAVLTNEPEDLTVPLRLMREAIRLAPVLGDSPVLGAWWGIRPMTPDGRPLVGAVRPGLVVAAGHGSVGVTLGAGTARLVGSLVMEEEPPFDPRPFDPTRFGDQAGAP